MSGPHLIGHEPFRSDVAACRTIGPEVMYPEDSDEAGVARAKAVCAPCPVRAGCLDHALAHGERYGVWGGMTAAERWKEARRRRGDELERVCIVCGVRQPIDEFGTTSGRGMYRHRCKPCQAEYERPVAAQYRARKRAERASA